MFMYSADSGVDGPTVLPDVDEKRSRPEEIVEDAIDCLRYEAGSRGEVSVAKKLDAAEGQPEGVENDPKSSTSNSILDAGRVDSVVRAMLALCLWRTSCRTIECLHWLCQFHFW